MSIPNTLQSQNAFTQAPVQGQLDLRFNMNTLSVEIDSSSAGSLVPGQAVKMVDSAGGIPKVVECAANSDDVCGFIAYDIKSEVFNALDKAEIAFSRGNCMYMTASGAIARNGKVAIVVAGQQVVAATAGMTIVGRALDKAVNPGDLIRVVVDLPGTTA